MSASMEAASASPKTEALVVAAQPVQNSLQRASLTSIPEVYHLMPS